MNSLESFLHMGGYAGFVWPAYVLTFTLLLLNHVLQQRRQKRILRQLGRRATGERAGP